jgi:hypothetical protein
VIGALNNQHSFHQKFQGVLLKWALTVKTRPYLDKTKGDLRLIPIILATVIQVKKENELKYEIMARLTSESIL